MPELPEVEVICRGIRPRLTGRQIKRFAASTKKLRFAIDLPLLQNELAERTITTIRRRAKYIEMHLDNGAMMILHLGMTGNLGFFSPSEEHHKHDHLFWLLDDGQELRFNDTRRFGALHFLTADEAPEREQTFYRTTGPEPFDGSFTAEYLKKCAANRDISVKVFIMNNIIVAGIGNIYANESLFRAGLLPARKAKSIKLREWQVLIDCIREVLEQAIECGGSTISDFIDAGRSPGYFQMHFQVYGRGGEPCLRCGTTIDKEILGGRASYYCSTCQL